MILRKLIAFVTIPLLLASASASATVISTGAAADDWFSASNNYTSFSLSGNPTDGYLRTFGIDWVNRSALEFSLAGVTAGSQINSAVFSIQSRGTAVSGGIFQFYGYSGDGAITVADALQTSYLLGTTPTLGGQPLYTLDVTSFVQSLINNNATFAGILIKLAVEGNFLGNDLVSSESTWADASDRPSLKIDFQAAPQAVPAPASIALILSGLLGLGYRRILKK